MHSPTLLTGKLLAMLMYKEKSDYPVALINCSECDQQVSDKAASCPTCGAPVASAKEGLAAGIQINTVQETAKTFKLQLILSVCLMLVSAVGFVMDLQDIDKSEAQSLWELLIFIGLCWYLITRLRIWWHHK